MLLYFIIPLVLTIAIPVALFANSFNKTAYHQVTHNSFFKTIFDVGLFGEFKTYDKLKSFEKAGYKFLFNCYVPKNDDTTEIDVLMIGEKGIVVFESKNYSGWIFGNEKSRYWTQTLPQGSGRKARKEKFFNPLMQNSTHVKWLSKLLDDEEINLIPIVIFSDRCEFKKLELESENAVVIHRCAVKRKLKKIFEKTPKTLSAEKIESIYNTLYPLTQVDEAQKQQHIDTINEKHNNKS